MTESAEASYEAVIGELKASDNARAGKMFGMPSAFIGTKAFAGYREGAMMFKLGGRPHEEALALAGAHLFEPMAGRQMKEWVVVPVAHSAAWGKLGKQALDYVAGAAGKK